MPENSEANVMRNLPFILLAGISALGGMTLLAPLTSVAANLYTFQEEGGPTYYTNAPGLGRSKFNPSAMKLQAKKKSAISPNTGNGSFSDQDYAEAIISACEQFAVDPHLVRAVIKAESNFNPEALSPKGAIGLMQLMPDTAQEMGVSDPFDPVENIQGGVGYLSQLLNSLNGDVSLALAAYNAGPKRVMSYNGIPPFRETRNYIDRVLSYYQLFKGKTEL